MTQLLLRGGTVVDGKGGPPVRADIAIDGSVITAIGDLGATSAREQIDCSGRLLMPGFVDTHSHADAKVFDKDVQLALLRQGVTTIIAGQDGVSFAPGSTGYASEYFAALNGTHEHFSGGTVGELLDSYDGRTAVNVAYLVPYGTVRAEVMGFSTSRPSPKELVAMRKLVERALEDGAVGMSSGMDYFPGAHGDVEELAALCAPLAAASAVYVTHMRGGYEHNAESGVTEVEAVARLSGVAAHISHYHGPAKELLGLIDDCLARDIDMTFDSYPYRRGFTLLSTILMPSEIQQLGTADALAELESPSSVDAFRRALPLDAGWADGVTLAYVGNPVLEWAEGLTITEVAARLDRSPFDAAILLLRQSRLAVSAVFDLGRASNGEDIATISRHHRHMTGSDGIYVGAHPHPRGWGTFSRMLGTYTRERADWTWSSAAEHLASRATERFGLTDRGRLESGAIADVVVVDPERVSDRATYSNPRVPSVGIDDVIVGGVAVLRDGELTGAQSGLGLRRR